MSGTLKTLLAKLKRRRKSKSMAHHLQNSPHDDRSGKADLPILERMASLTVSPSPSSTALLDDGRKNMVTFGNNSHEFDFTFKSTTEWPGPQYDKQSLFAPGVFDKARPIRPKVKQKSSKRKLSQESGQLVTLRAKEPPSIKHAREVSQAKKSPRPVHYYGSPPFRDPPHHLLNLPGEIRNQIYRLVCVSHEPINAQFRRIIQPRHGRRCKGRARQLESTKRFPREPTLAMVCRQLMREVLSIFYRENTFTFRKTEDERLQDWIMTRGRMMYKWAPGLGFIHSLRCMEVHFTIRTILTKKETLIYTLRKLADESVEVTSNLDDITIDYCKCFDGQVIQDLKKTVAKRGKQTGMFFEASKLADFRSERLSCDESLSETDFSGFRAKKDVCETCGRRTVRMLETGM